MSLPDWRDEIPQVVRKLQIIVSVMMLGATIFLGIVFMAAVSKPIDENSHPHLIITHPHLIIYIALGVAAFALIAHRLAALFVSVMGRKKILGVLRKQSVGQGADNSAEFFTEKENEIGKQLIGLLQTRIITVAALLEGFTFLLIISFLVECSPLSVTVAGLMIALLGTQFPTLNRASDWIEKQYQLLKESFETIPGGK